MSSLFDIGRSGLQSYRRALAVTGQNITNVNTDGYKRREANLKEVAAGQGDIYSVSRSSGLGVRVSEISRSFDEFLLNKARTASSKFETSNTHLVALQQLESLLVPGDSNVGQVLEMFFSGLHDVSNLPSELGPRIVAIQRGEAVADSFNSAATAAGELKQGLVTQADLSVKSLNALTEGLLNINDQLTKSDSQASQSLLDSRDNLIDQISEMVRVNVALDRQGRATVRIGDNANGPKLVDAQSSYTIDLVEQDDRLLFQIGSAGSQKLTNQVVDGRLAGYAAGYFTVNDVVRQLDNLALVVARDLNAIHRKGITLEGEKGGDLFLSRKPTVSEGPTNVGSSYVEIDLTDPSAVKPEAVTFRFNDDDKMWVGFDASGRQIASGRSSVALDGMTVSFFGTPAKGDEFTVDPARNAAAGMTFVPRRGQQIAAAASRLAFADPANASEAPITVLDAAEPAAAGQAAISDVFGNDLSSLTSKTFLKDCTVAVVPANADKLDLASLVQQGTYRFSISDDELPGASSISMTYQMPDGSFETAIFSLVQGSNTVTGTGWTDAADIARLMNVGAIKAAHSGGSQVTLADIGAHAAAKDGQLTISMANGDPYSGNMIFSSGTVLQPEITDREATAAGIQVFTREGRHVAGSVLDASAQASLMTADNGFIDGAVYNADYLNIDNGYLGMGVDRRSTATENLIISNLSGASGTFDFVRLGDIDGSVGAESGNVAHAESASYTLNVEGFENTVTVDDFGIDATSEDVARAMIQKFRDNAPVATLTGSAVSNVPIDGSAVTVSFEGNNYQISMVDGEVIVTGGEEGRLQAFFSNDDKLYISSTSGTISASQITVLGDVDLSGNATAAATFGLSVGAGPVPTAPGFSAYDYTLSINGAQITATRTDSSQTLVASVSATSAVGERVILTDLPDEELIVMVTGGARKLTAAYDMLPADASLDPQRDLTVKVTDANVRTVEFIDTATGTSMATRTLDSLHSAKALGIKVTFDSTYALNDQFHVTANLDGKGDARNILELVKLQNGDGSTGGFREIFTGIVSGLGSQLQSTAVVNASAKDLYEASVEIESAFSGVSLDTEASNLIQQQQAYQASARILATAREIFNTLLESV